MSITVSTTCRKCGATIFGQSTSCSACMLESGLTWLADGGVQVDGTAATMSAVTEFGDFKITVREDGSLWELGHGGMGVTYLATDNVLRRNVALKVIDVQPIARTSRAVRERFLREARAAAALRHPNVAAVYQFGASLDGSQCYYAMELVEGETLEARVRRAGPLNAKAGLEIAMQITRALSAAATEGLIHRDLKPANIMLTHTGTDTAELQVKVIDFGLAKAIADAAGEMDLTHGEFVGTPNFASPEQFDSGAVDTRSDIYSLGATLWFALTGKPPYTGRSIEEVRSAQKSSPLPVEQLEAARVPSSVRSLLKSMLALEPAARPGVQELTSLLQRCSAKEVALEIGHVLFLDLVGYSKLSINEQRGAVDELTEIVRSAEELQKADAADRLIKIATGDGMALVFYTSPEDPVRCATEISRATKSHPRLHVRMGIHSGPVSGLVDVNGRANLAGAGLNTAQRLMDCGDAGHILLSKHLAEDLEEYQEWRPLLHDLGTIDVKHGMRLRVVNLYGADLGRPELPSAFRLQRRRTARVRWLVAAAAIIVVAAIVGGITFSRSGTAVERIVPQKSIAILPFDNLSEDKANSYFADGVQDEILTRLAQIADMKVISRTSVMQYKSLASAGRNLRRIAGELGVAHVLEGSVQRAGNKVRVNAQLIDARTDTHLWAQTYDRDLADVFAIQSEIAKTIADQLQAKLSPREKSAIEQRPTADVAAFDLYARAKDLSYTGVAGGGKLAYEQSIELLKQAISGDPSFFDAYCQLAWEHDQLYLLGYDHTPARLALAKAAVEAAARLRPDAGETHLARAHNFYADLDYSRALDELELARKMLPNDSRVFKLMGYIQRRQPGRYEESTRSLERALDLDPRNPEILNQLAAFNYQRLRRFADAKSAWDRLLAIKPDANTKAERATVDFGWKADIRPLRDTIESIRAASPADIRPMGDRWIMCALADRDTAAAREALKKLPNDLFQLTNENVLFNRRAVEGIIARMAEDEDAARAAFIAARAEQEKVVQAQPNDGSALCVLGVIDAGLGRSEQALQEGRRAIELLPTKKDAPAGSDIVKYFAMIAAWVGDKDLAFEQLDIALHGPSGLSYGELKLMPMWDPLRGDPRFGKILSSLAPK